MANPITWLVLMICIFSSGIVLTATAEDLVSLKSGCECSMSLSCTCCQGVIVKAMDFSKMLCMILKVNVLQASVDMSMTLDGNEVLKLTLDTKTTPSFCVPIISQITPMVVCFKMDAKVSVLKGLNICPIFYSSFAEKELLSVDFPCLKLGMDGISIA
ncbi:GH22577 [Drosophila grimshawi]|uniref:GH22577 n=1 Tax=Drosophila grimshawi TaxID=7222 RepID=B4K3G5_DROGR|nr:GH22577 [Drosophila grimshawi]